MARQTPYQPGGEMLTCWFAGLATLDVIHRAARPDRDQKVTAARQDVSAGGPAANAAVTAAAMGVRAVLVTALGTSAVGTAARADLEGHGVEVHDVGSRDHSLAVSAVLVDDATGERSVVSADGALTQVAGPGPDELAVLPVPDVVLLDGHHPGIARAVLEYARTLRPRPPVLLDAGRWRPVFADLLPDADVIARSAAFRVPAGRENWYASLSGATVVTHGPGAVEWWHGDAAGTVAVPRVAAVDTLGAGDAFHGALAVAVARGAELPAACAEAVRVASLRVQHIGPRDWLTRLSRPAGNAARPTGDAPRTPQSAGAVPTAFDPPAAAPAPGTSDFPAAPAPDAPLVPDMPASPRAPSARVTDAAAASGVPAVPEASGVPAVPGASGGGVAPNVSGGGIVPDASGGGVVPNVSGGGIVPDASGGGVAPDVSGSGAPDASVDLTKSGVPTGSEGGPVTRDAPGAGALPGPEATGMPGAVVAAGDVGSAGGEGAVPARGEGAVPAELVERARGLAAGPGDGGPVILGITGPPGAGKSTLAAGLAAALGSEVAVVVGMDGFHLANVVLDARGSRDRKGAVDTFDDAGYCELIRRIAALRPGDSPVLAPEFRREIEEPIANAVVVRPDVRLVITEGNYLLADSGHWPRARAHMAEVWYVDLDDDVRLERLTARHHAHGKTLEAAREWSRGSDQRNAEFIVRTRDRSDRHVTL